jgi:hypothetical protein
MAVFTLLAILTLVPLLTIVVLAVAGIAILWRLSVISILVAIGTLGIHVSSGQREARRVMVELCFLPQVFVMTISTLDAQRALVHVVLAVATVALQWRIAELFA